jgi:8-amino-7-oxononanoate synthase
MNTDFLSNQLNARKSAQVLRNLKLPVAGAVDFCSNDYLGFAQSQAVAKRALQKYESQHEQRCNGSGGSRLLAGNQAAHVALEQSAAQWFDSEACLLFNSGYAANQAVLSCIPQKGDIVLYDELSHACIKEGLRLGLAKFYSFRHNDVHHLTQLLQRHGSQRVFVVVESAYSMDGDYAPLMDLVALCEQYEAFLIVDEAHTTAIHGVNGAGYVHERQLQARVFCRIMTFGKGLGAHGAMVCGSQLLVDYLINFARPFIYTTALPLHAVCTIAAAKEVLEEHPQLQQQLFANIAQFKRGLTPKVPQGIEHHPVQSILLGNQQDTRQLADLLQGEGLDVRPIFSPTVPKGTDRIRICIHSYNTPEQIGRLCAVLNGYFV